ncbi:UBX-domain-containing protein [Nadsonia fulvescens var. elongata DSM 6958]|uniref:UBX-domain-containing protein n=1 Tax=Nadsonia fulvescens var. elongata DSM 6958 TaxID=857566 RepID=A0A1E3PJD6_9ASCO|nr:UBX-domain-containing protein [Nadsonia fulvescens var. elongata DSM 6958]
MDWCVGASYPNTRPSGLGTSETPLATLAAPPLLITTPMSILSAISSHDALLGEFRTITGLSEDNNDPQLRSFLQSCDWNLEIALGQYFDNPNVISETALEPTFSAQNEPEPDYAPLSVPSIPPTYTAHTNSLLSYFQTAILLPFTLGGKLFTILMYILSFMPRFGRFFALARRPSRSEPRLVNPQDTARNFIRQFHDDIDSETLGPAFAESGYTEVINLSKSSYRFVLVILQSDECDITTSFNRGVLASQRLNGVLNQHEVLVWGGNVAESEAYQVANALHCTQFPFSALIALSAPGSSSNSSAPVMTVLARLQGPESADVSRYVARLLAKLETHGPTLAQMRDHFLAINRDREAERQIRRDQDDAYARSLARDRELSEAQLRQQQHREQERLKEERQLEQQRQRQQLRDAREVKASQWRIWRAQEFQKSHPSQTSSSSSTPSARISIRLANGERIVQNFLADDCLEDIYAFIECRELISNDASTVLKPKDYNHEYNFDLVSPMPRQVIPVSTDVKINEIKVIWPSGTLVVEKFGDSDDDS